MSIKYSIIVPAYNVESYVERALRSVIAQTETNYECIIVNDGSTDNTLQIVKDLVGNNEQFKIISQKNQGLSAARNTAIRNANGKYLVFLDADDYFTDEALAIMERNIEEDNEIAIFDFYKFEQGYDELQKMVYKGKYSPKDKKKFLEECLSSGSYLFTVWRVVISRTFFVENELWFYEGIIYEDELWTIRCLILSENIKYINEIYYCYRVGRPDALTMKQNIKQILDLFIVIQELQKFAKTIETNMPNMAEIVYKRCSQLFYTIIRRFCLYEGDEGIDKFEKVIYENLNVMKKVRKYNVIIVLCKILGVNRTSHILKLVYKIKG